MAMQSQGWTAYGGGIVDGRAVREQRRPRAGGRRARDGLAPARARGHGRAAHSRRQDRDRPGALPFSQRRRRADRAGVARARARDDERGDPQAPSGRGAAGSLRRGHLLRAAVARRGLGVAERAGDGGVGLRSHHDRVPLRARRRCERRSRSRRWGSATDGGPVSHRRDAAHDGAARRDARVGAGHGPGRDGHGLARGGVPVVAQAPDGGARLDRRLGADGARDGAADDRLGDHLAVHAPSRCRWRWTRASCRRPPARGGSSSASGRRRSSSTTRGCRRRRRSGRCATRSRSSAACSAARRSRTRATPGRPTCPRSPARRTRRARCRRSTSPRPRRRCRRSPARSPRAA